MKYGIAGLCAIVSIIIANVAALFTAIFTDIIAGDVLWVLIDCLVSPVGVIRGWLMWFGVI